MKKIQQNVFLCFLINHDIKIQGKIFFRKEINMDKTLRLTIEDAGTLIEIEVFSTFSIMLEENPTTGFRWEVGSYDEYALNILDDSFSHFSDSHIGGGGVRIFTIQMKQKGISDLSFYYKRSWEKEVPPKKECIFHIKGK